MASEVVNDRFVQLNPGYSGGPRMQDNAVIPLSRTAVPISVDEIVDSLDQLAKALGPNGANAHGALSAFVASSAHAFGGNGTALHSTLTSLGQALNALSSKSPQLTALFDNLGNLSHVASRYTGTYQAFANNLAAVSTDLAGDDSDIGSTLANLQKALGALAQFTATNSTALGSSVTNLDAFAGAVAAKQQALAQALQAASHRTPATSRRPSIRTRRGARRCGPDSTPPVTRPASPSRCAATRCSVSCSSRSTDPRTRTRPSTSTAG